MNSTQAEKWLAYLYTISALSSLISLICAVTAWKYWSSTLNTCIDVDCGCILYGVKTLSGFMGGKVRLCQFATFGHIPAILLGVPMGLFHGYRTCITRKLDIPRVQVRSKRGDTNAVDGVVVRPKSRPAFKQWILLTFLTAALCCLSVALVFVVTDGYYKTCDEYRRTTIKILGTQSLVNEVIYERLGCQAIFDFMDYLQPDINNWGRGDIINTGAALQSAIVCSWLNFFTWTLIFIINSLMARQMLRNQNQRCCCSC